MNIKVFPEDTLIAGMRRLHSVCFTFPSIVLLVALMLDHPAPLTPPPRRSSVAQSTKLNADGLIFWGEPSLSVRMGTLQRLVVATTGDEVSLTFAIQNRSDKARRIIQERYETLPDCRIQEVSENGADVPHQDDQGERVGSAIIQKLDQQTIYYENIVLTKDYPLKQLGVRYFKVGTEVTASSTAEQRMCWSPIVEIVTKEKTAKRGFATCPELGEIK